MSGTEPSGLRAGARAMLRRAIAVLCIGLTVTSCGWRGIANVPLPIGPGTGPDHLTISVQLEDTLALNTNSRVRVADVWVGTVREIRLTGWFATLTLNLDRGVRLPADATARVGQTSLLGTQHIELAAPGGPAEPSARPLRTGDTIPLARTAAYPTIERTLAAIAVILNGGGIPNLEAIQNETLAMLDGRAGTVREFLDRLRTFTAELNTQRDELTRAIDETDRLVRIVADRDVTLDRVLTDLPPLIEHFADTRALFVEATEALGAFSAAADEALTGSRANLTANLHALRRPLRELERASPLLIGALKLGLTAPFNIDTVHQVLRGDYLNFSGMFDLTLSTVDNAVLTGTGISGMLRALEQSWGRDPETMLPDVRYTPNPNNAPGGPLVERSE